LNLPDHLLISSVITGFNCDDRNEKPLRFPPIWSLANDVTREDIYLS
jgi:hypothetical protein